MPLVSAGEQYFQHEAPFFFIHQHFALIFLHHIADTLHAEAVIAVVLLGGDGQAVFKLQFAGAEIFKTDADQLAVFVHLVDDDAVFGFFRL